MFVVPTPHICFCIWFMHTMQWIILYLYVFLLCSIHTILSDLYILVVPKLLLYEQSIRVLRGIRRKGEKGKGVKSDGRGKH